MNKHFENDDTFSSIKVRCFGIFFLYASRVFLSVRFLWIKAEISVEYIQKLVESMQIQTIFPSEAREVKEILKKF